MKNSTVKLITEHGDLFEIPEGGALGLLALGYVGVMLWREKKRAIQLERQNTNENNQ